MYIGLFLVIPFLNIVFHNITQKQAKYLIYTLIALVALPSVLNIFQFSSLEWWKTPSKSREYIKIFPAWWNSIYPVMYYYLGAYLSRYGLKMTTQKNLFLLFGAIFLDGLFNCYRSYGSTFIWGSWNDYSSLFVFFISLLVFILLLRIDAKSTNPKVEYIFQLLSDSCLGAYLISCFFDTIVYQKLMEMVPEIKNRFYYAPITVMIVFFLSISLSMCVELGYRGINQLIQKVRMKEGK